MKFIIATGGTGGHLFPALRVAEELKAQGHDIVFLGSFNRTRMQMQKSGFPFEDLGAKGLILKLRIEMVISIIAMIKALYKALRSIKRIKPDVVLGFGGYGAFPVVLSAVLLRCPALIHEQNVIPGRANALLAKFVQKIAISFQKSAKYFDPKKTVLSGCPCCLPSQNINRKAILNEFQLKENKTTILVSGGSQGSQRINEIFVEAFELLKEKFNFQVIHVSGKQDHQWLQDYYNQLGISFALFEFLDKMKDAYAIADLVISRAGAVTVSEIANFRLPAIFIPYPHAGGHQKENASVLCETKLSRLIEDKDCSAARLAETISEILEHPLNVEDKAEDFKDICFPGATQRLAQEALTLR